VKRWKRRPSLGFVIAQRLAGELVLLPKPGLFGWVTAEAFAQTGDAGVWLFASRRAAGILQRAFRLEDKTDVLRIRAAA
jgi:hypothetical protein